MAIRAGIELSPVACRIVEIDGDRRRVPGAVTRVRAHAVLPSGSAEMLAKLATLRRLEAGVVVWGVRSLHHQVFVPQRRYDQMREDALALARDGGAETTGMVADIAPSGSSQKGNRPVLLAMASTDDLSLALRPILDAGVRVRSVTTPAGALVSLARLRREGGAAVDIEAGIVLEETTAAVALMRGGDLVAARELSWGFRESIDAPALPRPREEMMDRLIDEMAGLCATVGMDPRSIGLILVCGGPPELRSLAAAMTERLDVEVEPLDSLFGVDAATLPEPRDDFLERSAELRLAWAVAADWIGPIDLMRYRHRRQRRAVVARAAVVAGVGVGLGAGWLLSRGDGWVNAPGALRSAPPAAIARPVPQIQLPSPPPAPPPVPVPAADVPDIAAPAPAVATVLPTPVPPAEVAPRAAAPLTPVPAPVVPAPSPTPTPVLPPARAAVPVLVPGPAPARAAVPAPSPNAAPRPAPNPVPTAAPNPKIVETVVPVPQVAQAPVAVAVRPQAPPPRARERPAAAAVPFDAVLGTILYSSDRKLAIIDGRIVGVGEEVKGARVLDITPTVVTLRDGQGRLRTLTLAGRDDGTH